MRKKTSNHASKLRTKEIVYGEKEGGSSRVSVDKTALRYATPVVDDSVQGHFFGAVTCVYLYTSAGNVFTGRAYPSPVTPAGSFILQGHSSPGPFYFSLGMTISDVRALYSPEDASRPVSSPIDVTAIGTKVLLFIEIGPSAPRSSVDGSMAPGAATRT